MCQGIFIDHPTLKFHTYSHSLIQKKKKRLGFHFDTFVRECRDIIDRLFSDRIKDVLPSVIENAVEVASTWPSRRRGDQLLTALSYRSACRRG